MEKLSLAVLFFGIGVYIVYSIYKIYKNRSFYTNQSYDKQIYALSMSEEINRILYSSIKMILFFLVGYLGGMELYKVTHPEKTYCLIKPQSTQNSCRQEQTN